MPINVVIADDHPLVLAGLDQLFRLEADLRVVARCRSAKETLEAVRRHWPRVLVLDIRLPDSSGIDVLAALQREPRAPRVILLTAAVDDGQLAEAMRLGAAGVVLKETAPERLLHAVRDVAAGRRWLEPGMMERAFRIVLERREDPGGGTLTPREREIVRMAASGLRNRAISQQLRISEGTVKMHLHNIYEKLGVVGRVELALRAQRLGLI
jgi:two-component system, NarL family, nitrate/nitrite response regulator NarL